MKQLLLRAHIWLHDAQESRRTRMVVAGILAVLALAAGVPVCRTALDLAAQRQGILAALASCNIAKQDPAAVQLLNQRTVTANGQEYGGALAIPSPEDLFSPDGELDTGTKQDLAWRLVLGKVPGAIPFVLVQSPTGAILGTVALAAALALLVWVRLGGHLLEWGLLLGVAAAVCWWLEMASTLRVVVGGALLALMFAVLWRAVQAVLSSQFSMSAVARVTAIEGIRGMVAMGFALPIVVLLPVLAVSRDPRQGLYQAIPGFLDWGHTAVYVCAALLAIIFGCATTAFEIRDRQVWTVLTKPVSRLDWMLGKWLGIMALCSAVLVGGTVALYVGAHYLAAQPALDERDSREVRDWVLVGREGVEPALVALSPARLLEIVNKEIDADPSLKSDIDNRRKDRGTVEREIGALKAKEFAEQQRSIPPGQSRDYTFAGLGAAATGGSRLTLRYKLHAGADDSHRSYPVIIEFRGGDPEDQLGVVARAWTPSEPYSLEIDPKFVDARGLLKVRIYNAGVDDSVDPPRGYPGTLSMYFDPGGLQVMYPTATFAGNLARALAVDLAKIAFLAALAVASAAILSFPVAVLLTFGIFSMASLTPFLAQSLQYFYPDEKSGAVIYAFQAAVKLIAQGIEWALSGFAQRAPSDLLAQGKTIEWTALGTTVLLVGVMWTGGTLLVGWLWARTKEVAVYSGQG